MEMRGAVRCGAVKYLDFYGLPWSGPDPEPVALEAWRTEYPERWGRGYVTVYPLCLTVSLSEDRIKTGETANIAITMKKPDGTPVPFEEGEYYFSVEASGAPEYGMLHSVVTGDEGAVVCGMQPFEFIAADSLETDSAVVEIRAEMVYECDGGGGGAASISSGSNAVDNGNQVLPHQIQMRRAIAGNIAGSDAKLATTKKARRISMRDGLKTRLSAIDAIKKDKAKTDKIVGKSMNTGSKGPFSAKINMKTSLSQEGEMCEPPVAALIIKEPKFRPCTGLTEFEFWDHYIYDYNHVIPSTTSVWRPDNETSNYINPVVCYNKDSDCYSLSIPEVRAEIKVLLNLGRANDKTLVVYSENDIPDLKARDYVLSVLDQMTEETQDNIDLFRSAELQPPIDGIEMYSTWKVLPPNIIRGHEDIHVFLYKEHLRAALNAVKRIPPPCEPRSEFAGMSKEQIEGAFYSYKTEMMSRFERELNTLDREQHNRDERLAFEKQLELVNSLIIHISNKEYNE
jgi:hypothetical protein